MIKIDKRDILQFCFGAIIGLLLLNSFSLLTSIKRDMTLILNAQENIQEEMNTLLETKIEEIQPEEKLEIEEENLEIEEVESTEEITESIPSVYSVFTLEEIYMIQRCVETETYQQDISSKINVACVVFNRYKNGSFGKTITGIITAYRQFAYHRTEISESTIEAVEIAWEEDTTNGALFFHSNPKTETFNGASYLFSDLAGHHFYK